MVRERQWLARFTFRSVDSLLRLILSYSTVICANIKPIFGCVRVSLQMSWTSTMSSGYSSLEEDSEEYFFTARTSLFKKPSVKPTNLKVIIFTFIYISLFTCLFVSLFLEAYVPYCVFGISCCFEFIGKKIIISTTAHWFILFEPESKF